MNNIEILTNLRNLDFSYIGAKWSESQKYQLNYNNTDYPYYAIYLMDNELNDFTDEEHEINIKYAMYVYDDCDIDTEDLYIVIGQNPSHSSNKNIDGTNQNIYKALLSNKIHRYLLLNTFPIIDPDGANSQDLLKVTENINSATKTIESIFEHGITVKIIYACGNSLPVYAKFIETIESLIDAHATETYAFAANDEIQTHLSMQALNSKKIEPYTLKLLKCGIKTTQPDGFKTVTFIKGG